MNSPRNPLIRRLAARASLVASGIGFTRAAHHRRRRQLWRALHRSRAGAAQRSLDN